MCEKIVNIYCTFCGAGYCHGNALHADLSDGGKLAQELWELLDAMRPELADSGVSAVGVESQCSWGRMQTLVSGGLQREGICLLLTTCRVLWVLC